MTRKRVGGWIWWVGGVFLAGGLAWFAWVYWTFGMYHPFSANFDPVIESIRRSNAQSSWPQFEMKACCFAEGAHKNAVTSRLNRSGFKVSRWDRQDFGPGYQTPSVMIYSAVIGKFPCDLMFFVAVEFDSTDRLIRSEGTQMTGGCL